MTKQKVAASGLSHFRGEGLKPSRSGDEETADNVLDELKRWEDKDLQSTGSTYQRMGF